MNIKKSNNEFTLGDRMKRAEKVSKRYLSIRTPVIIRIDGKAFHTFCRNFDKPFSDILHKIFCETVMNVMSSCGISGAKLAYFQSDEISILLTDWTNHETQAYFDYNVSKLESVICSMVTAHFNNKIAEYCRYSLEENETLNSLRFENKLAYFDARAFNLSKDEVVNYFIWRQQDASRNSIQMLGSAHFSVSKLHCKNNKQVQEMLITQKDINWNNLETWKKRGTCVKYVSVSVEVDGISKYQSEYILDEEIPIFTMNREYITSLLI